MLEISPSAFRPAEIDVAALSKHLGTNADILDQALPLEIADGDFTHLVLPVKDLAKIRTIEPDFQGLRQYCRMWAQQLCHLV